MLHSPILRAATAARQLLVSVRPRLCGLRSIPPPAGPGQLRRCSGPGGGGGGGSLLERGQFDSGFVRGTALFAGACLYTVALPQEVRLGHLRTLVDCFRWCGLDKNLITDKMLIQDFLEKNLAAAQNVIVASPTFYFLFAWAHAEPLAVCVLRSISGTMRIVPFMGLFYFAFATMHPFLTAMGMQGGQAYEEAMGGVGIYGMMLILCVVESLVELRGCGVPMSAITPGAFAIFYPALLGRLAAGIVTQQQKTGVQKDPLVPQSWSEGADWQRSVYDLCKRLHVDIDFVVTAMGTSVFQHILNGITFTLLKNGRATTMGQILGYMTGGINGTAVAAVQQFMRTFTLRFFFGFVWNFASSQKLEHPTFDLAAAGA